MQPIKDPLVPVAIGTAYLVLYTVLLHLVASQELIFLLYFLSPFVVMWMVVRVLKADGPREEKPFPYS